MRSSLRAALEELVSPAGLLPEEEAARWCPEGRASPVVVAPSSAEEMAAVLAKASEEGWRVLPAGQGRWLSGGGPVDFDLILSTRRLAEVEEYEPADLTLTAGAGLTLASLEAATRANGQWLPVDPPGGSSGSLGAAVSIGRSGPLGGLYGAVRDQVLGLSMVSGDGRILRWGGRVVKNVAGFDLTRLVMGSWGSLGIITSVSARLFPVPESEVTILIRAPDPEDLLPAAGAMVRSGLPLTTMELLDPLDLPGGGPLGEGASRAGEDASGAGLVLRLLGSRVQVNEVEERILGQLNGEGSTQERLAGGESLAFHRALSEWEGESDLVLRLSLLPSRLDALFEEASSLRDLCRSNQPEGAVDVRLSAHPGSGVLRVALTVGPEDGLEPEGLASTLRALRGRLEASGGSLVLGKAPRRLSREVGTWGAAGPEAPLLAGIKSKFDPRGIMAPGRFVV